MKFQDKIQALRKEKGLSQEKLAERIGVSRQALAKWELGLTYPDIEKLILLSDIFRTSIDRLIKENEDENCSFEVTSRQPEPYDVVIEFLCKAKRETYAAKGAECKPSRPSSHDLTYTDNDFMYLDTYLGGENFAGEEAVWRNAVPIWSMNYVGRTLNEGFSGDFLKECLYLVSKENPYRGPFVHQNGEYKYHCVVTGEFGWFNGYEEIFCNDKKVYECRFHGGSIK
jgi:transcriptional regulator with XRE-family HTH domain